MKFISIRVGCNSFQPGVRLERKNLNHGFSGIWGIFRPKLAAQSWESRITSPFSAITNKLGENLSGWMAHSYCLVVVLAVNVPNLVNLASGITSLASMEIFRGYVSEILRWTLPSSTWIRDSARTWLIWQSISPWNKIEVFQRQWPKNIKLTS